MDIRRFVDDNETSLAGNFDAQTSQAFKNRQAQIDFLAASELGVRPSKVIAKKFVRFGRNDFPEIPSQARPQLIN